jgi:hypothetical protein
MHSLWINNSDFDSLWRFLENTLSLLKLNLVWIKKVILNDFDGWGKSPDPKVSHDNANVPFINSLYIIQVLNFELTIKTLVFLKVKCVMK